MPAHRLLPRVALLLLIAGAAALPCPVSASPPASETGWPADGPSSDLLQAFFSPEEIAEWKAYQTQRLTFHLIGLGCILVFYLLFFFFGLNQRLKTAAERIADRTYSHPVLLRFGRRHPAWTRWVRIPERMYDGRQWLVVLLYGIGFSFLFRLVFFPYHFYRSYWFEIHHGLSNYTLGLWLLDYGKGLLLATLVFSCMIFGIYGLMSRIGRRWWLVLWAGVSVALVGWTYLAPYRRMLYSDFRPLESGEVRSRLEALLEERNLEVENIYVVDASRRTRKVNAYVTGRGGSRRIVLYDTLLDAFTPREIQMILAHEVIHWEEPEEGRQFLVFSLTVFLVLFAANRVLVWGSRVPRLHIASPRDVAGLPLLLLTFFLLFLAIRPLNLSWKRWHEQETDRRSLEIVCDPEAFTQVHVKLARLNHKDVDPHPLVVVLYASHPPFLQRLETARNANCSPHDGAP